MGRPSKGFILAIAGLVLGVLVGLAVQAIKYYAAGQLAEILQDEVKASCDCQFAADSINISLLPLGATAKNARIISQKENKLEFKELEASFSLADISKHEIILSELALRDGYAKGVGEDSATYKFIDNLTAPIAPERDYPGRWKLKLHQLSVKNSRFTEDFTRSQAIGEGISLVMKRDADENFVMEPIIDRLKARIYDRKDRSKYRDIALGGVTGELVFKEGHIDFRKISMNLGKATMQAHAISYTKEGNRLEGLMEYLLDSPSLRILDYVDATARGSAVLGGTLGNPNFAGSMQVEGPIPAVVPIGTLPLIKFPMVDAHYSFDVNHGAPQLDVDKLEAGGSGHQASLASHITLDDDVLGGSVALKLDNLSVGAFTAQNADLTVFFGGTVDEPTTRVQGTISTLMLGIYPVAGVSFAYHEEGGKLYFDLGNVSQENGAFKGKVVLSQKSDKEWEVESADVDMRGRHFVPPKDFVGSNFFEDLVVTGSGNFSGPLDTSAIKGTLSFNAAPAATPEEIVLHSEGTVEKGLLQMNFMDVAHALEGKVRYNMQDAGSGHLSLAFKQFELSEIYPHIPCTQVSATAEYDFASAAPLAGTGGLHVSGLTIGCPPHTITLPGEHDLIIKDGAIAIPKVELLSSDSSFGISGTVSLTKGYDMQLNGKLQLNSLIGFLPKIDDLRGAVNAHVTIKGLLGTPEINGEASVVNADIGAESMNLAASGINGTFRIDSNNVSIDTFGGQLNGGQFELAGNCSTENLADSKLLLSMHEVLLEPAPNTTVVLDGNLELSDVSTPQPVIKGNINITSAEFQKNFNLLTILNAIRDYLLSRPALKQVNSRLPAIGLDIDLSASNNVFVLTNWVGAELKGSLKLMGSLDAPQLRGEVETLAGWFGLKDRKFEITSGRIIFKPEELVPSLEVISEATVRSQTGENVLILLEANGPLTNPKIMLSSDSGLSERELLNLVTTGRSLYDASDVTVARQVELEDVPLFRRDSLFNFNNFIKNLTRIDVLSLQPSFNSQSGAIEPSIIAKKKITDNLSAFGENSFGSTVNESKVGLIYALTPKLNLSGVADSVSTKQNTAFGLDLAYTILSSQHSFLDIKLSGNRNFASSEILQSSRLTANSRIKREDLAKIVKNVQKFYKKQGYFDTEIDVQCESDDEFCRTITIEINEGQQALVESVQFEGDPLEGLITIDDLNVQKNKLPATEELLEQRQSAVTKRLRSDGYIGARVKARFDPIEGSINKTLAISSAHGDPVSFTFEGNHSFSAEEFLETINLFGRKQPFGNNTINILIQNIERKYREAGFLYVTIRTAKEEEPVTRRINYRIEIQEEEQAPVTKVTLEGVTSLSEAKIREILQLQDPGLVDEIFKPPFAIAEQLDNNAATLKEVFIEEGFPECRVKYQILPDAAGTGVEVGYIVKEGREMKADWLTVEGFPSDLPMPAEPEAPYSIPKANRYLDLLVSTLKDSGYLAPEISSELDADEERLILHVIPGQLTIISEIRLEGNVTIKDKIVSRNLMVKAGGPWNSNALSKSKTKLLRLGLFSQVELAPQDGTLDGPEEVLVVKLSERPLQTLVVGGGLNSEYGLHIFGEATDKTLFRDGKSLALRFDSYYDQAAADISQGAANLRYTDPYFLSSNYVFTEDLRYQKSDISDQEYDLERTSLASYVYQTWEDGFIFSFGHTILEENLTNVSPDVIISELDSGVVDLSFLSGKLTYDQRNNPLNPTSGYYLNFDYKLASEAIASDANFYSLGGRGSLLQPLSQLGSRFTLALSSHLAGSWTYSDTTDVPITQRYYLGGRTTVRGFRENSLGPRGELGNVIGGDVLVANSAELQYLVQEATSLHVFLDSGAVYLQDRSLAADDMRYSTGIGVRYLSPIGPIGFDLGHPLDEKSGEPSVRLHFNIGSNF